MAAAAATIESLPNDKENNHQAVSNKVSDLSSSYLDVSKSPQDYSGSSLLPCGTTADPASAVKVSHNQEVVAHIEQNADIIKNKETGIEISEGAETNQSKNEKDGGVGASIGEECDAEFEDASKSLILSAREGREEDYFGPLKRLAMCQEAPPSKNVQALPDKQVASKHSLKSFSINDILKHEPVVVHQTDSSTCKDKNNACSLINDVSFPKIVRPWDCCSKPDDNNGQQYDSDDNMSISSLGSPCSVSSEDLRLLPVQKNEDSPLDALFQMTNKTFDELKGSTGGAQGNHFSKPLKKKRKTRTAFSNQQIFELEKRFLYQKYLSPADRDELAQKLGLSNAQVITWFQNRRAKMKRDMEELKKDRTSAALIADHRIFLKTITQMGLLKTKICEHFDLRK